MHPYFSVMDERWFHRAFVYTGSVTDREKNLDFRYRYEQVKGDDGDALKGMEKSCASIADELFKEREASEALRRQLKQYIDDAAQAKNEVSELKRELFKLQNRK